MRILIFNWHEGYIHLLAKTGYQFDIAEVYKGSRFGWIKEFRPVPPGCRLITEDEALKCLVDGEYDKVICQNVDDLLLTYQYNTPIIQLFHTKYSLMTSLLPEDVKIKFREDLTRVLSSIKDITLVFISSSKRTEWGFGGEVILPGIDMSEYNGYQGGIARALIAKNGLTPHSIKNIENVLGGVPCTLLGDCPAAPEAHLPASWDEYKSYLQSHRVYLSMLDDQYDDGYNLSMLEAMATGMPVVSVANATSPLIDGVNGYISQDVTYLRKRLNELMRDQSLAESLGKKARETVIEKFPLETFITNWKRVIGSSKGVTTSSSCTGRMQTVFEKNLSALREVNPQLAESILKHNNETSLKIVDTKTVMPSLKVDNISLHSLYDPIKEARSWFLHYEKDIQEAESISVLGFGLGYHVVELCKNTGKEITVFEPRLDILKTAMGSICLTSILKKIKIVTDENPSISPLGKGGIKGGKKAAILHHKPSVSISREYFEHLITRLKSLERINKGLKILVVSPLFGGSLPIAMYCSSTLKKMGHNVELIDNSRFADALFYAKNITEDKLRYKTLIDYLTAFLSEAVMARCETFRPDLVFALAQAPLTIECLERLRQRSIPTAYWFVEDFRVMDYWKNIAGHYDYFFTIQRGAFFDELKKAGKSNFHYLPLAASSDVHNKVEMTDEEKHYYGSDISFVGAGYYNRRHLFKGLLDYDFKIWGTDWDMNSSLARCLQRSGERIVTEEIVKIFNASRISINLHSSTYHKGINPFGDFVNPRTFEIAGCGAFQLVDRRSEFADLFEEGKEIVVFEDLEDLRKKINHYLNSPEEREMLAENARQKVLKKHTYKHRMTEMLNLLTVSGFQPQAQSVEGEVVEALIGEAGADSELSKYLSRFSDRERITLYDIVKDIETNEGDLSRSETLLLVMNEFTK
ncbi:MAG: glycosyltransferase [Nitrospirae bacterium]|nr:glycosyltransferase [Nitrospirota bacterium]